jgi:Pyruvate/2-oxoacid:ferredoxin oxidoreductase delta subunit
VYKEKPGIVADRSRCHRCKSFCLLLSLAFTTAILHISQKYPQCSGCGVTYQWLKGILCGGCIQRSETGTIDIHY